MDECKPLMQAAHTTTDAEFDDVIKIGRCRLTLWNPKLKPPGTKRLKLMCDIPPSKFGFKFNLRCYIKTNLYSSFVVLRSSVKAE